MLVDDIVVDLQERLAVARLMDQHTISVDVKVLQSLLDDYNTLLDTVVINSKNTEENVG